MTTELDASKLLSRRIRKNSISGKSGTDLISFAPSGEISNKRVLNLAARFSKSGGQGLLDSLWDLGKVLTSWIVKAVQFLSFSATTIWSWLVSAIEQIKAFNWNETDENLSASMASAEVQLAGLWGGVFGNAFGGLIAVAVGYGVGLAIPVIGGPLLARTIAVEVGKDRLEEFLGLLRNALVTTVAVYAKQAPVRLYMGYRNFLKNVPFGKLAEFYGEETANFIKNEWGAKGAPRLSFNSKMDESVESIKDPRLQAFVEEFLEEAWDSFIEGGYIAAQTIDDFWVQQKAQNKQLLGDNKTVVLQPDIDNDNEKIVFQNIPEKLAMPAIQQTINTARLLHNKDVGLIVAQDLQESIIAKPQSLRIIITLTSEKSPPWRNQGANQKFTKVQVAIPDVKVSKLDWETIKLVCGINGYNWGRFKAIAKLDNGREMSLYGGTEEEAMNQLEKFLTLTTANVTGMTVSEEQKKGQRLINQNMYKTSTRIYPAFFIVINRASLLDYEQGHPSLKGNFKDRKVKIDLWTVTKPNHTEQTIKDILNFGVVKPK